MATVVKVAEEPVEGKASLEWIEKGEEVDFQRTMLTIVFPATISQIRTPEEASIAALAEEFGSYQYVNFDDDGAKGSASLSIAHLSVLLFASPLLVLRLR